MMSNALVKTVLLCMMTLGIWSCSESPTETGRGGTGTETVNTFAVLPDGTPAACATAQIIESRWWIDSINDQASPVIGTAVADNNGFISLRFQKHSEQINLQIDHKKGGLLLPLSEEIRGTLDTVHLLPYASYSGTCTGATTPEQLLLAGTSYRTDVGAAGTFSFEKVAPGPYAILHFSLPAAIKTPAVNLGTAVTLSAGAVLKQQEFTTDTNHILIDNFESGIGPSSLGRIFPVLGWYVLSDSLYYYWDPKISRWTRKEATIIGHSPISYDSVPDGNGGTAFSFSTTLDPISLFANAVIGISLKPLSSGGVDLSSMTGFSLRAGGKGIIRVRFESKDLDTVSILSHYTHIIELSPTLQTYHIPVDSLTMIEPFENDSLYPWENESRHIVRLEFEFSTVNNKRNDSLTLILDDFSIEGVSMNSLFPAEQD